MLSPTQALVISPCHFSVDLDRELQRYYYYSGQTQDWTAVAALCSVPNITGKRCLFVGCCGGGGSGNSGVIVVLVVVVVSVNNVVA